MSWDLFFTLYMFNELEKVKEYQKIYTNYFNKSQLEYYYNNDDIYNYNYDEILKPYTPKPTKNKKINKNVKNNV